MAKKLENDYRLPNGTERLTPEQIRRALSDFEFFMGNYQQIVDKGRRLVPFRLNEFQKMLFSKILPMVHKETRLERRHHVVVVKGRQVGCSVGLVALINYICAYVSGAERISCGHVMPIGDTVSKFYQQKVAPLICGTHPDLFPDVERETLSSSIVTHYRSIKGVPRDCYYEVISSGASSIRSSTINILLEDECSFYAHPEALENAILPAIPDYGFSLVVYLSTVDDRRNTFFLDKIKTAIDNPEDWTVIFAPWYMSYPEEPVGINFDQLVLSEYEEEVIIPAMAKDGVSKEKWGDCIDWYRRRKATGVNMKKEYPTTLDEVLELGEDDRVFSEEALAKQDENILSVPNYSLLADTVTGKIEAKSTDDATPLKIYVPPAYGHKYRICIDPITSISETSDYFAMQVMDTRTHEQAAVFHGKQMSDEDYADYAVNLAKLYNNAQLCPEVNVASGFIVGVNSRHYYNWYYASKLAHNNKIIGLRTTATSKPVYLDKLKTLLDTGGIKIHDPETLQELRNFVKKTKGSTVKYEGKGKTHDDLADSLFLYAGSLNISDLKTTSAAGWSFL